VPPTGRVRFAQRHPLERHDGNSTVGVAPDVMLRDWTDNANFVAAPLVTTNYGVKVRCSTELSCTGAVAANQANKNVRVCCPGGPHCDDVVENKPGVGPTLQWQVPATVHVVKGCLSGPIAGACAKALQPGVPDPAPNPPYPINAFAGTVHTVFCTAAVPPNAFWNDPGPAPALPAQAWYYLVRDSKGGKFSTNVDPERHVPALACNANQPRDTDLTTDATLAGSACPLP
jgi:hypothetical protein